MIFYEGSYGVTNFATLSKMFGLFFLPIKYKEGPLFF